jgi:hypothetical protein
MLKRLVKMNRLGLNVKVAVRRITVEGLDNLSRWLPSDPLNLGGYSFSATLLIDPSPP